MAQVAKPPVSNRPLQFPRMGNASGKITVSSENSFVSKMETIWNTAVRLKLWPQTIAISVS